MTGRLLNVKVIGRIIIGLVWCYRGTLGLVMGGHCRFNPSCSQYMIDAVTKYGPFRGAWRGTCRVCRCHPFHRGDHFDPA